MLNDGINNDIDPESANKTHVKFISAPDYPNDLSPVEIAKRELKENKPILYNEIGRLAREYGGDDPNTQKSFINSLVSLYMVLEDAAKNENQQQQIK